MNHVEVSSAANQKTVQAYRWYAQFYPIISLLAYWIVWRGNIFKHMQFFRGIVSSGDALLDVATGDGSLTQAALTPVKRKLQRLVCLDISPEMLDKARKKLPWVQVEFVLGDVLQLPYAKAQWKKIACFGGFNSFPSGESAMQELARVLAQNGVIRGSVLLMPQTPWRQKLVRKWIREGFQTEEVTLEKFKAWTSSAQLQLKLQQRYGDVILFELEHAS